MTDEPDNLTLRYLRRLDGKIDRLTDALADLTADVRGVKTHMASFMREVAQDGSLASIKVPLDRIERRLDLQEPRA